MSAAKDFKTTFYFAKKAVSLMEEKNCPASPRNFEIWFDYVNGQNQKLKLDVDGALARSGVLTDEDIKKIHTAHFSKRNAADQVEQISAQVSGEIDQVMNMVRTAVGNTSAYGQSLGGVSEQLVGKVDQASLDLIVQTLATSTSEMERNNKELENRLQESQNQITILSEDLETVRTESRTDQLTGIANRKCFDEQITKLAAEASDDGSNFCLLIGDIDHFKKFNDTYGHRTGDQVLRLVARSLEANLKGRDLAARYGGEEFAVLLPMTELPSAVIVADQIRESIRSKELVKKSTGENLGTITMSIGAALYRANEPIGEFVHRADACLYTAKNAGRDKVVSETAPGFDIQTAIN